MAKKTTKRKKVRAKKPNAAAFAKTSVRGTGGSGCHTCNSPEVAGLIREAMEVWASGEGQPSYAGLHKWILENTDYTMKESAMWNHCRFHEKELYDTISRIHSTK